MNYNKVILFISLVFICLVIIHYHSKIQLENTINIHQIETISIDHVTSLKKTNMPIVMKFKDVNYNINLNRLQRENPQQLNMNDNKIKMIILSDDILPSVNVINKFKNILNIQSNYSLHVLPQNIKLPYLKTNVSENVFILEKGEVVFRLFHPNNQHFFNFINKKDLNYHYKLDKSKKGNSPTYIDIIIHKNQGLYIPYNWIYQIITFKPSLIINYQYMDLFSKIAFLCLT